MPKFSDSVDKIITSYVNVVNTEPFTYNNCNFIVKPLHVSPLLLRDTICPAHCGACCSKFSLDWIPSEKRPDSSLIVERYITINNKEKLMYSIIQPPAKNASEYHCMFVNPEGRCMIHGVHPFSCDFELIRPMHHAHKNLLLTKLYGRCWNLLKVNGERRGLCKITEINETGKQEVIRKLKRLKEWCDYFEINTKIDTIIEWANSSNNNQQIII